MGLKLGEHWTVGKCIGSGAYGLIQEATDNDGNQAVVKSARAPSEVIEREYNAYTALHASGNSQGCPKVFVYGREGGLDYLVMERLGETVAQRGISSRMQACKVLFWGSLPLKTYTRQTMRTMMSQSTT